MKLSFTLFILPLVAAAAQDGHPHDSSPVEAANSAADRHHLRRVLTAESVAGCCGSCHDGCANKCYAKNQGCTEVEQPLPEGQIGVGKRCAECVAARPRDVDGSILEEE